MTFAIIWQGGNMNAQSESPKIAMIIAKKDFRDEELLNPKSIFEKSGYKVVIFSDSKGEAAGMLGAKVNIDESLKNLNVAEYKAIIFVGGMGAMNFYNSKIAHSIAKDAVKADKVLGAICVSPVILANAGVLKGRNATVFTSEKTKLIAGGAKYTGRDVETDGNIVTASGPQASADFAYAILDLLK